MQIESHSPEVVRMSQQAVTDVDDASRLQSVAGRFEHICTLADAWQRDLQVALIHSQDFHHTIDNLREWLGHIDTELTAVEPVNLLASQSELRKKRSELKVLYSCSAFIGLFIYTDVCILYSSVVYRYMLFVLF